ncbi:Uncharacterized protein Rs2_48745 [Raphanus sativus]|nr:Uncharacterized protein Rs2_48745 [Raphanus sativus]
MPSSIVLPHRFCRRFFIVSASSPSSSLHRFRIISSPLSPLHRLRSVVSNPSLSLHRLRIISNPLSPPHRLRSFAVSDLPSSPIHRRLCISLFSVSASDQGYY